MNRRNRTLHVILPLILIILLCVLMASTLALNYAKKDVDASGSSGSSEPEESSALPVIAVSEDDESSAPEEVSDDESSEIPGPSDEISKKIAEMTLKEKVFQLFITTPEQITGVARVTAAGDATRKALEEYPVGGLIYFAQNVVGPAQLSEMISNTKSYCKITPFISIDEEGGSVARIARNTAFGITNQPAASEITTEARAKSAGLTIGNYLAEYGFNLDFAPVADVNSNPLNRVIGTRAFSTEPETTASMVAACVSGFKESGTLCTLKHFPGHGDTVIDSHLGYTEVEKTLEELRKCEFLPFEAGINAGADLVMVGHIAAPNVTGDDLPATLSYKLVTEILRGELGFDGVIITDSLSMKAITDRFDSAAAAVGAIKAGCDILLTPEDLDKAVEGIINAVSSGEIDEKRIDESVYRILKLKEKIK